MCRVPFSEADFPALRMIRPGRLLAVLACLAGVHLSAQSPAIPAAEALLPPTATRLGAIHAAAQRDGWARQIPVVLAAADHAYRADKLSAAEAWYYVFRWAALFGASARDFESRWVQAINRAKVGHPGLKIAEPENRPLGVGLTPELQAWLVSNPAFSDEFFSLLEPVDYVPQVFAILNDLHRRDPARFKTHASLALAIAVVYDVAPHPFWPHGQVRPEALPRKLPAPAEAFAWWIKQEQLGRTYHRFARLGADELKFVVDASAPFAELEWSHQAAKHSLNELAGAYAMIRYRNDRLTSNAPVWPGWTYRLSDILLAGGICADQAYFATQVGKARGVPTLLFYGAGNSGRHAWFGFLDGERKWRLDAGRYAEQRFVTGFARDPQTWAEISDHDLQFLAERFRNLPSYRQSRVHTAFAAEYLAGGDAATAALAARKAVNFERRNRVGWEILVACAEKQGRDARTVESILREAALAFQKYPDLEAHYVARVAESLRARGDTSAADAEIRRIARKNEGDRSDLSVLQARNLLVRAIDTQPLPEQIRSFNSILTTFGAGAGVRFFDEVVVTFVEHLVKQQQPAEAARALERARQVLKVEPNSQFESEVERFRRQITGK